jgi:hypothetical protein
MHRTLWLVVAALLVAGTARAQVAVPELVPAGARFFAPNFSLINSVSITPDNPAALQWADSSLVAVGNLSQHNTQLGFDLPTHGYFGGARVVSSRFAIAFDTTVTDTNGGVLKVSAPSAALSLRLLEGLAIGVGADRLHLDASPTTNDFHASTLGVSWVIGKVFYLGYARGHDTYSNSSSQADSRDTRLYGVALRTQGPSRWLLSVEHFHKDAINILPDLGIDGKVYTIQHEAGDWVFGASRAKFPFLPPGYVPAITSLDVGWVPQKGHWSATARLTRLESSSGGLPYEDGKTWGLTGGYRF